LLTAGTMLVMFAPPSVHADVYKCTNAGGLVTYQDEPCQNSRSEKKIVIEPTATSADELAAAREAAAALRQQDKELAERLQRDTESLRELAAATPPPIYAEPEPVDDTRDTDRAIIYPYQPGVWRAGVYYPPQYGHPYDYRYPGHPHHQTPGKPPMRPSEPRREPHSKLGHSKDEQRP
jgi:hypothetical protein